MLNEELPTLVVRDWQYRGSEGIPPSPTVCKWCKRALRRMGER